MAEVSEGLGEAMVGINCGRMAPGEKMAGTLLALLVEND